MKPFTCVLFVFLLSCCHADVYLHNPRGTNNRLNERSAERRNANRLFDSQNNNRGGYNVGDKTDKPANTAADQFNMNFFQSGVTGKSYLTFEWTNQHGSGGNDDTNPHKMNSNIVLQYKCQWVPQTVDAETLRNGVNTNTPKFTASNKKDENAQQYQSRKNGDKDINRGLHESWDWYEKCKRRERNQDKKRDVFGIFTNWFRQEFDLPVASLDV